MNVITDIFAQIWYLIALMAPSLLVGFFVAGVFSLLVTKEMVYKHLGRSSFLQICKASLFGVPLPLCSCSVLPVAASLRQYGAGRGSFISFLTSTPQTGVDSIFITYTMLGPVFTVVRFVAAFISGIICGSCVHIFVKDSGTGVPADVASAEHKTGNKNGDEAGRGVDLDKECEACSCAEENKKTPHFVKALRYAFVTLPQDMGRSMVTGLIISGILTAFLPANYFADKLIGNELTSMLVMLAVGLTIYVCSSASVPLVVSLIAAGISPGAGLVFLIAGPSTNAASIVTVFRIIGAKTTVIYLATLSVTAIISGVILNMFVDSTRVAEVVHGSHDELSLFSHLCGVALLCLFVPAFIPKSKTD
ncbi:MAG: SO_0444 family Cu/Zn efflux transporter [Kiritimatiellia bacterium]